MCAAFAAAQVQTLNPAFIQEEESTQRRNAAAKVLKTAASKNKSPRLAAIAIKVQLDAFVRVLKPMCIDTGMSYKERVEKREEEIEALKGALCQLDAEGVEPSCQ